MRKEVAIDGEEDGAWLFGEGECGEIEARREGDKEILDGDGREWRGDHHPSIEEQEVVNYVYAVETCCSYCREVQGHHRL